MTTRSLTLVLPLVAALAVACGSDGGLGPTPAAPRLVLTRLEVSPGSAVLIPAATYALTIKAWDQFGARLLDGTDGEWADRATYVSSAPEIARVSSSGLVTAIAPGVARITASLTIADSTLTGSMIAKVDPPTVMSVILTTNGYRWFPNVISLKAPAIVTWIVPDGVRAPTLWLNVWDDSREKLDFVDGVVTRTLSTPGSYYYGSGGGLMWTDEGGVVNVF